MAYLKDARWFADWIDDEGKRRRKSFTKKGDAVLHERRMRAHRKLTTAARQLLHLCPSSVKKHATGILRLAKELQTA